MSFFEQSKTPVEPLLSKWQLGHEARHADAVQLALLFKNCRLRTMGLLEDYSHSLGQDCRVPNLPELNPPLWELCHVAWFYDWWLARNPEWQKGWKANPNVARKPSRLPDSDWRLNSSLIAHDTRWDIGLPDLAGTRQYLQDSLIDTLALLDQAANLCRQQPESQDQILYFFRLSLLHEQMHNEAAVFMARLLQIPLRPEYATPRAKPQGRFDRLGQSQLQLPGGDWQLGWQGPGFAFDNELRPVVGQVAAFEMDMQPVCWADYLAFSDATGWKLPSGFELSQGALFEVAWGRRSEISLSQAVTQISWDDAQAWCLWAGRRLPTEAEWEMGAMLHPEMDWGVAWEWTADTFLPFEGFEAHPYVDYSKPWFHDRKVLKGGAWSTSPQMVHPKYRNYFQPDRQDVLTTFRSCRL